jgi:hypothetical protein
MTVTREADGETLIPVRLRVSPIHFPDDSEGRPSESCPPQHVIPRPGMPATVA